MGQEYWEEQPSSFLSEYAHFSGNSFSVSTPVSAASPDTFQLSKIAKMLSCALPDCRGVQRCRCTSPTKVQDLHVELENEKQEKVELRQELDNLKMESETLRVKHSE